MPCIHPELFRRLRANLPFPSLTRPQASTLNDEKQICAAAEYSDDTTSLDSDDKPSILRTSDSDMQSAFRNRAEPPVAIPPPVLGNGVSPAFKSRINNDAPRALALINTIPDDVDITPPRERMTINRLPRLQTRDLPTSRAAAQLRRQVELSRAGA